MKFKGFGQRRENQGQASGELRRNGGWKDDHRAKKGYRRVHGNRHHYRLADLMHIKRTNRGSLCGTYQIKWVREQNSRRKGDVWTEVTSEESRVSANVDLT